MLNLPCLDFHGNQIDAVELPTGSVVVTRDFDSKRPIGLATLRLDGPDRVVADLLLREDAAPVTGLYPATGGQVRGAGMPVRMDGRRQPMAFAVQMVALCDHPNKDATIEPL